MELASEFVDGEQATSVGAQQAHEQSASGAAVVAPVVHLNSVTEGRFVDLDARAFQRHLPGALVRAVSGPVGDASVEFTATADDGDISDLPAAISALPHAGADVDLMHLIGTVDERAERRPTVLNVFDPDDSRLDVPAPARRWRRNAETAPSTPLPSAIVAPSRQLAERIVERCGVDVYVNPLAPQPDARPTSPRLGEIVRDRHGLPETFVLDVSSPGEATDLAAQACRPLDVPVIHGRAIPMTDAIALHSVATVVVSAEPQAAFGIAAVDAVARGASLVTTAVGALPEIFANALDLVCTSDVDALTACLYTALHSPAEREARRLAAVDALSPLSWGATAARTLDIYADLGVGPGGLPIIDLR